jgi:histone H3/H4
MDTMETQPEDQPETQTKEKRHKRKKNAPERAIPRSVFRRLVRELADTHVPHINVRFQDDAFEALQQAGEDMLGERFSTCGLLAELCRHSTVKERHWHCGDHLHQRQEHARA